MRYKTGDVVKLRDDLEDGNWYGTTRYAREMDFIKGKPMELTEKSKIFGDCYITKDENDVEWYISDEMIQGLWEECKGIIYEPYEEKTNKYKLIDILNKIANGELKEGTKVKWGKDEYTYYLPDVGKMVEPTDNTKIEELIDWYATTNDDKSTEMLLHIVWNKLNEVIRKLNKEE